MVCSPDPQSRHVLHPAPPRSRLGYLSLHTPRRVDRLPYRSVTPHPTYLDLLSQFARVLGERDGVLPQLREHVRAVPHHDQELVRSVDVSGRLICSPRALLCCHRAQRRSRFAVGCTPGERVEGVTVREVPAQPLRDRLRILFELPRAKDRFVVVDRRRKSEEETRSIYISRFVGKRRRTRADKQWGDVP